VSKDYTNEIGYEGLLSDFKRYQKETPRGVGMTRKGQNIYLQFKTPNTVRKPYACGCTFTLDGMVEALSKSKKVAEALKALTSEVEFWDWYDKEVKQDSQLVDDRLTFAEAIAKVEGDFWNSLSRTRRKRDKSSPSDISSWYDTYGLYYKRLPGEKMVNVQDVLAVINSRKKGKTSYAYAVSAMKKLCRVNKRQDILEVLEDLDVTQTEFIDLQTVDLGEFLKWRDKTLGVTTKLHPNVHLDTRKAWLWVFSTQIVYALRISEVFAIKNLTEPYVTKDGIAIPSLDDASNTENLIVIGGETILGTTTKTGYRLARPQIPPKYPDLIERLQIKFPVIPSNRPKSKNPKTIKTFWAKTARDKLLKWDASFTQTHAERHLGNINGMQAGIALEVRAQSMGHTPGMNDRGYKKRQSTQTTIDLLLNSNQSAIDFVSALAEAKKLVAEDENNREVIIRLLSIIYQKDSRALAELL
jgi:hypothetical protein